MNRTIPVNSENSQWAKAQAVSLSVVMLGFRDAHLLETAVRSFAATASKEIPWELVLVLNGASAEVSHFAARILSTADFPLKVISIPSSRPGAARNHGVRASRSELVFFLDDDTEIFQDLVASAVAIFSDSRVMAAGGANLTPPDSGALERATGEAMSSRFGAGSMRRRYLVGSEGPANEHSLILCNLVVRKKVFESQRGFATHLISNEENVLLQRLEFDGDCLWQSPLLSVYHRRRRSFSGLWEQAVKYGSGRAQNLLLLPQTFRPQYLLPLAWLIYLASLPLALVSLFWLLPLAVYASCAGFLAVVSSVRKRDPALLLQLAVFPIVHAAYGWGFLLSFFRWSRRRKTLLEHAF